ncbi:MAG: transcriptional regulator, partial [Nitrospina sp.]|nr:transcriptional regulator [Nitrospina sp.]
MDRHNSYISNNKDVLASESLGSKLIDGARNQFWLAPMAGITDVCFRQLMDEMGAG